MDARITKHRLANMLSYDWLKILVAVAFAIAALSVFFTMVRTRATAGQTFTIYGYTNVNATAKGLRLDDELVANKVFSYDVLEVNLESFQGNAMSEAAYSARRAAGEGRVVFVSNYLEAPETEETEETVQKEVSDLWSVAGYTYDNDLGRIRRPSDYGRRGENTVGYGLDIRVFFAGVEEELTKFFGDDWAAASSEPDADLVRETFRKRNGKDNRYRFSSAKFEVGVKDEAERLKKLRSDYLAVRKAFERGALTYVEYPVEEGEDPCAFAVGLGNLGKIKDLYSYTTAEGSKTEDLCLLIFDNGNRLGDLVYEPVSLLRYLAENYDDAPADAA